MGSGNILRKVQREWGKEFMKEWTVEPRFKGWELKVKEGHLN